MDTFFVYYMSIKERNMYLCGIKTMCYAGNYR